MCCETDESQKVLYRSCTIIINPLALELNAGSDLQKAGIEVVTP